MESALDFSSQAVEKVEESPTIEKNLKSSTIKVMSAYEPSGPSVLELIRVSVP